MLTEVIHRIGLLNNMPETPRPKYSSRNIFLSTLVLLSAYFIYDAFEKEKNIPLGALPIEVPTLAYGVALDTFITKKDTVQKNQFIADIFLANKVSYNKMTNILAKGKDVFDVRGLRSGKPYVFLYKDTVSAPEYFVYDASPYKYYLFDLKKDTIAEIRRPIEKVIKTGSGVIESSLWNAFVDNDLNPEIAVKMEEAFAWSLSLQHLQKGDRFKLIFEEEIIEGKSVGIGKLYGAVLENSGNHYYAFNFRTKKYAGFFDEEGRPMEKQFLKSPVEYARISSRYNPRRFHPIDRRVKAHRGTDYAAPKGTPIRAVANGVVTRASYTSGNGNYVKIRHDKTYDTQYLHMQRFAKGISRGAQVKQGQTIGYVGKTGKATGPHVCFRFWKNNRQVDHLKLNFPPADPMPDDELPAFMVVKDSLMQILETIPSGDKMMIEEKATDPVASL
ncbi:MAG: peptidoglycan DD-metalloendopeptidase family protein [Bacteroidia bacterium]|nr:peptidoglycan DD-metalloendopeptidase family protein [Bacteroidia bacterium]